MLQIDPLLAKVVEHKERKMIKRSYFMNCRKLHGDGKGSYSFQTALVVHESWFPRSDDVYADMLRDARASMKDKPGETIEVVSFSRA